MKKCARNWSANPNVKKLAKGSGSSIERIYDTLKITQSPISLSTPLGEGDDSTLGEFIEDQNSPNPDLCTMQNNLKEVLEEVIQTLFGSRGSCFENAFWN